MSRSWKVATSLGEAIDALGVRVIEPGNPWYVAPDVHLGGDHKLAPLARLRAQILRSIDTERFFLSGHIGSGKSTELRRMLADPALQQRFYVIAFDIEPANRPSLTSYQLLFLIAAELYRRASEDDALTTFTKKERWQSLLSRMDKALYGPKGISVKGGKLGIQFDLFFLKLQQDLSVDQGRRTEFRKLAETEGSILVDLINHLADDIENALATAGLPDRLLIAIDDLDKLLREEQLHEIFDTNLGAFLAPRVPVLATVPPSITFGGPGSALGQKVTHLRPVQVLRKSNGQDPRGNGQDTKGRVQAPMSAADPHGVDMMRRILAARVDPALFDGEVVNEAAVYSGGVIRDFFYLLRQAAIVAADLYGESKVGSVAFSDVLVEETNNLARMLYATDREALREVRKTHSLTGPGQLDYMRQSIVLEYNHDGIWWEVAPRLWEWLAKG
ncbi:MAG: AAA family ATPase [Polyangiaceae bacterium]